MGPELTALEVAFGQRRFDVHTRRDLTAQEMFHEVTKAAGLVTPDHDSFLIVIISHGANGVVSATDTDILLRDLVKPILAGHCSLVLALIPRLIIADTCQAMVTLPTVLEDEKRFPKDGILHCAVVKTALPGKDAWFNDVDGSRYIKALNQVLNSTRDDEILSVLLKTQNLMYTQPVTRREDQSPWTRHDLKKIFLL